MREHNIDRYPSQEPAPAGGERKDSISRLAKFMADKHTPTSVEHTAGPYRVESDGAEVYLVDGSGLEAVAIMAMPGRGQRLRDGNRIVQVLNAHDELVAALNTLLDHVSQFQKWQRDGKPCGQLFKHLDTTQARAALALASEGVGK
jgi:hypothetical protein